MSAVTAPPTLLAEIPSGVDGVRATLRTMVELAREGKVNALVRETATRLVRHLPPKDYRAELETIHAFVRDDIRYLRDVVGTETLHTAEKILTQGQGDCDDKSILLASLLMSTGKPCRFVALGFTPDRYSHVIVECRIGNSWIPLETTVDVPAGWNPPRQRRRMQAHI